MFPPLISLKKLENSIHLFYNSYFFPYWLRAHQKIKKGPVKQTFLKMVSSMHQNKESTPATTALKKVVVGGGGLHTITKYMHTYNTCIHSHFGKYRIFHHFHFASLMSSYFSFSCPLPTQIIQLLQNMGRLLILDTNSMFHLIYETCWVWNVALNTMAVNLKCSCDLNENIRSSLYMKHFVATFISNGLF